MVLYGRRFPESGSFSSLCRILKENTDTDLILVDNAAASSGTVRAGKRVLMIRPGKNIGIARACNLAVRSILERHPDKRDWCVFLDDDTEFPDTYFEKLLQRICDLNRRQSMGEKNLPDMLAPYVVSGGEPLSPLHAFRLVNRKDNYLKYGEQDENALCINSGLGVRLTSFCRAGGFSGKLFLDFTDFEFQERLHRNGLGHMELLDVTVNQHFSGRERHPFSAVLRRFRIYRRDFRTFCRLTGRCFLYAEAGILKRGVMILLKQIKR